MSAEINSPDDWQRIKDVIADPPSGLAADDDRLIGVALSDRPELAAIATELIAVAPRVPAFLDPPESAPRHAASNVGDVIGGFTLLKVIGEGGSGRVFLAEQTDPVCRRVAVKLLHQRTADRLARFWFECNALASVAHPGIATIIDAGQSEHGEPYLVMELVEGDSIVAHCDANASSVPGRVKLVIELCDAVEHAHRRGVIHRDLKPSNVLVTSEAEQPVVKVIDFGIATTSDEIIRPGGTVFTRTGDLLGTPHYMAPEQTQASASVDTRVDVYAIGAILYELLAGKPPHAARDDESIDLFELLRRIRHDRPSRPSTVAIHAGGSARGTVPSDLDWIVMRAVALELDDRYPSPRAFGDDLRRFLADEPVEARPPGLMYRSSKLIRRHRLLTAACISAAIVTVAGISTLILMLARVQEARSALVLSNQQLRNAMAILDEQNRQSMAELDALRANANLPVADDVRDVVSVDMFVGNDRNKRYFLFPPRQQSDTVPLLLVMPGGDGGTEYHNFVRRIVRESIPPTWAVAQVVAPRWSDRQMAELVWPTESRPWATMMFSTEDLVANVIQDAARGLGVDSADMPVYLLAWSSAGPAAYELLASAELPIEGAAIAMSVFRAEFIQRASLRSKRAVVIHAEDDAVVAFDRARAAVGTLQLHGADAKLAPMRGGHGWKDGPYLHIRRAVEWLGSAEPNRSPIQLDANLEPDE